MIQLHPRLTPLRERGWLRTMASVCAARAGVVYVVAMDRAVYRSAAIEQLAWHCHGRVRSRGTLRSSTLAEARVEGGGTSSPATQ